LSPGTLLIEQLVRDRPDNAVLQRSMMATLSNMKRFDEKNIVTARQHGRRFDVRRCIGGQ
jgi:hypothetical protein